MNNEQHRICRLHILTHLLLFTVFMYNNFCPFSSHLNSYRQGFFSSECPLGYRGIECIFKCPFPTYGPHCFKTCNCSEAQCDFTFGCKLSSSSGINTLRCINFTTPGTIWNTIYTIEFENASILPKVLNNINWKVIINNYNKTTFSLKKK